MVPAILCTIFCFLPTGIAAIVYASQVNARLTAGDIAGALRSSSRAKLMCWISLGVLILILVIALASSGGSTSY